MSLPCGYREITNLADPTVPCGQSTLPSMHPVSIPAKCSVELSLRCARNPVLFKASTREGTSFSCADIGEALVNADLHASIIKIVTSTEKSPRCWSVALTQELPM